MSSVRFQPQTWLTVFLIAVFVYVVVGAADLPLQGRLFPWTVGFIALAVLAWQLLRELRPSPATTQSEKAANIGDWALTADEVTTEARRRILEMFGWVYGLIAGLWLFGFYLAIPAMIFFYLRRYRESWIKSVAVSLCFWLVIWGVFDQLLHLPFPPGQLFKWLGLQM